MRRRWEVWEDTSAERGTPPLRGVKVRAYGVGPDRNAFISPFPRLSMHYELQIRFQRSSLF